ncbi:TetR family transcriptional regulator [Brevibacterium album]|uniref:TetR family transcriptional regulator n=1 Tax=Brevibacterium album TaxID=417948 RepID=UPI00040E8C7F|nr:TetR family transcriptional regulator [Brevibacterium album]
MALTVDTVADMALRILSDFGLGDLTMRRLARELGVQPSALYWHVADKQSLLVLLAERIAAEADALADSPRATTAQQSQAAQPGQAAPDDRAPHAHLQRLLAFRTVLLRYRESAEIVILAYSISGAAVLPAALRELTPAAREQATAFVLGSVAIEQSRALFSQRPHAGAAAAPEESAPAEAFRAGLAALLRAQPSASAARSLSPAARSSSGSA